MNLQNVCRKISGRREDKIKACSEGILYESKQGGTVHCDL